MKIPCILHLKHKQIDTTFKPTELKNYPVQGLSTGDIVPEMLGRVYRLLQSKDMLRDTLMVNTVHDSILFDVKPEVLHTSKNIVEKILNETPAYIEERFGIEIDIPMTCEVTYGTNWLDMKTF